MLLLLLLALVPSGAAAFALPVPHQSSSSLRVVLFATRFNGALLLLLPLLLPPVAPALAFCFGLAPTTTAIRPALPATLAGLLCCFFFFFCCCCLPFFLLEAADTQPSVDAADGANEPPAVEVVPDRAPGRLLWPFWDALAHAGAIPGGRAAAEAGRCDDTVLWLVVRVGLFCGVVQCYVMKGVNASCSPLPRTFA